MAVMNDPKIKARLPDLGGTEFNSSPEEFGKFVASEVEKWGKVIKAQNINMDGTLGVAFPCPADFNQDGGVDGADAAAFFLAWEAGDASSDANADGGIDGADVEAFFMVWEAGGC